MTSAAVQANPPAPSPWPPKGWKYWRNLAIKFGNVFWREGLWALCEMRLAGVIVTEEAQRISKPGVLAAGDVRSGSTPRLREPRPS